MSSRIASRNLILGGLITGVLLVLLAILVDWQVVLDQLNLADLGLLTIGILLLILGMIVYAVRWWVLLRDEARFIWTFHASNTGNLINLLLPARPGDLARILMLGKKENVPLIRGTTSLVIERWYEQVSRLLCLGGAILFGAGLQISKWTILGTAVFLIGMMAGMVWMVHKRDWISARLPGWLAALPRVDERKASQGISTLLEGLSGMVGSRTQIQVLLWSMLCWALFWAYRFVILLAIFPQIDLRQALGITIGSLALVPPSATTVPGMFQASLIVPLALVGFDRSLLAAYALVLNLAEMTVILALGAWGMLQTGIPLRRLLDVSLAAPPQPDARLST